MSKANPLAENVRRLRLVKGWSQFDLAAKCGLHHTQISRIERGSWVHIDTLQKLAQGLGVSESELMRMP